MKLERLKANVFNRLAYAGIALVVGISSTGCFYSRTVDTEPAAPVPPVVQVQPAPPVVYETAPTVATTTTTVPAQHDVTTSWGPDGTVQKQTTTLADPDGVPVQKQTTTTWQPTGAMQSQTTTTT